MNDQNDPLCPVCGSPNIREVQPPTFSHLSKAKMECPCGASFELSAEAFERVNRDTVDLPHTTLPEIHKDD